MKFLTSPVTHSGEKLVTIRILLECLQHILKMYTWSLAENQASVQFKCRLIGLMLQQSLFRKHDFAVQVLQIYDDNQNHCFRQWKNCSNDFHEYTKEEYSDNSTRFDHYGGGKSLIFSSEELRLYVSADLHEQQYQFLRCVRKDEKQDIELNDGDILCNAPLNILVPKLTLKSAKELANLHDMYMPSKILLKMHKYCWKIINVKLAQMFLQYLNLTKLFPLLNANKHGIRKIKKNVLNMTKNVHSTLNIESHIRSHHRSTLGLKKMLSFHLLYLLQSYVRILSQISVLTFLQMCLKKLVVQFVEN